MRQLHVITDMQFGSCGKGLFAGYLARAVNPDTLVTAWAPNAGHTYVDEYGNKMVNIALPNGIIAPTVKRIFIGPGSVINPTQLLEEIQRYRQLLIGKEIYIHEHAAVVNQAHRDLESMYGSRIGSTMKGVGEAAIEKIRRSPDSLIVARDALRPGPLDEYIVSVREYNSLLDASGVILIEGAQGFSLGINQGFYPYTTSRECTTAQLLSDCAIPMNWHTDTEVVTYGVCRTFPIRVNNRGHWSGPCYDDQEEIDWSVIGVQPELTTVTKLPRRVFTFSEQQIRQAVRMNGIDAVFLNFCNYMMDGDRLDDLIRRIERYAPVHWTGWGPTVTDIKERT